MKQSYETWEQDLLSKLDTMEALEYIAGDAKSVMKAWHLMNASPARVAKKLNERVVRNRVINLVAEQDWRSLSTEQLLEIELAINRIKQ